MIIERFWGPNYPLPDVKETLAKAFAAFYNDGYQDGVADSRQMVKEEFVASSETFQPITMGTLMESLNKL